MLAALLALVFAPAAAARPVYLTFDDGPSRYTTQVLRILDRFDAKATFFVCGQRAQDRPGLVRRIDRAGHRIGNHSWSHPRMDDLDRAHQVDELRRTQRLLTRLTGSTPTLMRPPFGLYNDDTIAASERLGLSMVGWDVASADWDQQISARQIARWTLEGIDDGGETVLLHDADCRYPQESLAETVKALPRILRGLRARGLTPRRYPAHRELRTFAPDPEEAQALR
jgi:peptidoglycan-N-acetylglucosamine deacetylase